MSDSGPFPFASLFLTIPTPLSDNGHIDRSALGHVVDYAVDQAPTGLALLTEAAEDALLLPDERREIVRRVGGQVAGRTELLVAVSAASTHEAVALVRFAEEHGATAFILSTPGLPGLGYRELYRHMELVSRATDRPVLLEIRPGNAAFSLAPEEQATLAQHPGLRGAFVPQPSAALSQKWARRFKGRPASLLSGCALTFGDAAEQGATGVVCGLSLLAPTAGWSALQAVAQGDRKALRQLAQSAAPALSLLGPPRAVEHLEGVYKLATKLAQRPLEGGWLRPSYPYGLLKAGLKLLGHPVEGWVRPPYEAPSRERVIRLKGALKQSGFIG